jgi:hypothetical protein
MCTGPHTVDRSGQPGPVRVPTSQPPEHTRPRKTADCRRLVDEIEKRSELCPRGSRKAVTLAQRIIEMLIGRLITDEHFRKQFLHDAENTLLSLRDLGLELSRTEMAALISTDPALWARTADALDPRLQKASLTSETRVS